MELWAVGKKFHAGRFIRAKLEEHNKVFAAVARKAGTTPQNLNGVFKRPAVDSDILERLSTASGLDLMAMLHAERAQDMGFYQEPKAQSSTAEPPSPTFDASRPFQVVLTIDPDDDQMWKKLQQIRHILQH